MLRLGAILGNASDRKFSERIHDLRHAGCLEYIILNTEDMQRHRLRVTTDKGKECLVTVPRHDRLVDGAIVLLEKKRAIVVRSVEEKWLKISPRDVDAALELGYFAGNLHWRARFEGPLLSIAIEGAESDYLERLKLFLDDGRARRVSDD